MPHRGPRFAWCSSAPWRPDGGARRVGGRAARMVEVGTKDVTEREAVAECAIWMTPEACAHLVAGTPKGNPIEAARGAGRMGGKRTPDPLPVCHPIAVTGSGE